MPTLHLQVAPLLNPEQYSPLAEASYVTVRELPVTDWGYGGLTQAARRTQPG